MLDKNVYLTGFMGSGKSTVGPLLAGRLGYEFLDLDQLIVDRAGMPIPDLFRLQGEAAFRGLESDLLVETGARKRAVVALGGGALVNEENLRFALQRGVVVYLRLSVRKLVARLRRSRMRPLLRDERGNLLSPEALTRKIEHMMAQREPYYRRAHVIVDAERLEPRAIAAVIAQRLASDEAS